MPPEVKGWVRTTRDMLIHPTSLWGLGLLEGAAVVSIWWSLSGGAEQVARRWKAGGTVTETKAFDHLVRPPDGPSTDEPILWKEPDWREPHVAVYSVPAPSPAPHEHPTLRDLGENGQAHAIDFLAKDPASEHQSWKQLQNALMDERDFAPGEKDPFRFDRILVATVTKGAHWDPGDRMAWTRVFVQPINFAYAGYTIAATENEKVKVTSVEATNTRKFSADIGLTIPGVEGPKASLGPSSENTVKTTSDVTVQYERLGIDITPNFLRIVRESETGGDVVGNALVSLSLVTDPSTIQKRYPKDEYKAPIGEDLVLQVTAGHLQDGAVELNADQASITVLPQAPLPHCALRARVWMLYEQRHIEKGREYFDEALQSVSLLRAAEEQKDVDFVAPDDVSPAVWSIQILENGSHQPGGNARNSEPKFLRAHVAGGLERELVFTDYGMATKLAHWIRTHPGAEVQHLRFNYEKRDYEAGDSVVPVKNTKDVCMPGYDPKTRGVYQAVWNG
jgi:hypothetical protein